MSISGGMTRMMRAGVEDVSIVSMPDFSLFTHNYHRHTSFRLEPTEIMPRNSTGFGQRVSFSIPRRGDFLPEPITIRLPRVESVESYQMDVDDAAIDRLPPPSPISEQDRITDIHMSYDYRDDRDDEATPPPHAMSIQSYSQFHLEDRFEQTTCPICLCDHEYADSVAVWACGHCYHASCHSASILLCPVCRRH